jgi:hypothetical protein
MFRYILSIIFLHGCSWIFAQSFSATGDTVTICGPGVGAVGVRLVGGNEPFEYTWSVGQTEPVITPYVANSSDFYVTVKDATGRQTSAVARIIVNPTPLAAFLQPAPIWCQGQFTQLRIRMEGVFPLSFDYAINGIPQPPVSGITSGLYNFSINKPGLYQVTQITDGKGCQGISSTSIYVAESDLTVSGDIRDIKCENQSAGAINTYVTGGQSPYNYSWVGPQNVDNIPNPTDITPGDYYLTVTDSRGCQVSKLFSIEQALPLIASISQVQSVNCTSNGGIELEVSGGRPPYSYLWSNNLTVKDPKNIPAGTYTVTITDRSGCQTTASAQIGTDTQKPIATAVVSDILTCANKSVVIDGSGSDSGTKFIYRWEAEPGFIIDGINTLIPRVNQPGTYKLVVVNQDNGCSSVVTTKVVAEKDYPVSNPGKPQTVNCILTNATLVAEGNNRPDFSYHWTAPPSGSILGGVTTLTPIVKGVGPYTLTVTNNTNGCSSTASVNVIGDYKVPKAVIEQPNVLTCTVTNIPLIGINSLPKDSLTFYWTTANGSFQSNPLGPQVSITNSGEYNLVVTDIRNGCTAMQSVSVQRVSGNVSIQIKPDGQLTCNKNTVTLNAGNTVIGSGLSYEWTTDFGNFVSGKNSLSPVVNAPGRYNLVVTNPINNCIVASSVVIIRDNEPPVASAGNPTTINCIRQQVLLGDPSNQPDKRCVYTWTTTNGGRILGNINQSVAATDKPGIYTLTVRDTVNGCTASASVTIGWDTVAPVAVVQPLNSLSCSTAFITLSGQGSSTGAPYRYQWRSASGTGFLAGERTLFPLVNETGTYTLQITNVSNGCTAEAQTAVRGDIDNLKVTIDDSGPITCEAPLAKLTARSSNIAGLLYQWNTIDGNIVSNARQQQIEVKQSGTYVVRVTNPFTGCTSTESIVIFEDKIPPFADAGQDTYIDCKGTPVTLDGSASNSGFNYTYRWSVSSQGNIVSGNQTVTAQINAAGNYQLLVTNTQNGCTATDNVLVLPDAQTPVAHIDTTALKINCISDKVIIDGSRSSSGTNFFYTWSGPGIVHGDGTTTVTANQPGNYVLSVRHSNGCSATATAIVTRDVLLPAEEVGGIDQIINCRYPQIALQPVISSDYSYIWEGPGIISGTQSSRPVVDKVGQYTVTVTNINNGCKRIDKVSVTSDFTLPDANAGSTFQLTCFQTSYTIPAIATAGPNISYEWSTVGGHIVSPPNLLQPVVDGAGRYFLTVTNNTNGCTAVASVQIYQSANVPIANAGAPVVISCANATPMLDGRNSSIGQGIAYLWQAQPGGNIVSGATTMQPVVNQPGIYVFTVTDTFNQCSAYSSVRVEVDKFTPQIDAGLPSAITCRRNKTKLNANNASNGDFQYQWTTSDGRILSGDTTLTPEIDRAGMYLLTATNAQNGCVARDSVRITENFVRPSSAFTLETPMNCRNATGILKSVLDNSANVFFSWFTPDGRIISLSTNPKATFNQPGNYFLSVIDKDNGCGDTSNMVIAFDTLRPVVDAGPAKNVNCAVTTAQLEGSVAIPDSNYFYQWLTFNGSILTGANSLTPVVNTGGDYTLIVQNTQNGCTATDKVRVASNIKPPKVVVESPASITCLNAQVVLDGSNSAQSADIAFKWATEGGFLLGNVDSLQIQASAPGFYFLTALDQSNGCFSTDTVQVSANLVPPIVEAGIPFALTCTVLKEKLLAYASTGPLYTFTWSTPDGNIVSGQQTMTPLIDKAGTYYLRVVNNTTGCVNQDSVRIFQETERPDSLTVQVDSITCKIEKATLTFLNVRGGVGPFLYSINGGNQFSTSINYQNIDPGRYALVVQDANGCEYTQNIEVSGSFIPQVSIKEETILARIQDSVLIEATILESYPFERIDSIVWTPADQVVTAGLGLEDQLKVQLFPKRSGTFVVKVVSKDGCISTDFVSVLIDNTLRIFVANAFSPFATDAANRRVLVSTDDDRVVQIRSFRIYDRWGSLVFEDHDFQPNDPTHGWDGTVGGQVLDPAVYSWFLEADLTNGETRIFQGDTALVR